VRLDHPLLGAAARRGSKASERRELHRELAGAATDERRPRAPTSRWPRCAPAPSSPRVSRRRPPMPEPAVPRRTPPSWRATRCA
jgi:hypothetical protein